ncbi:DHA2 family efflux MFS transporter permease subunit [Filibacter tadaridae]|uniref:Putative multidrug resistance protein EmrY n=1 Tax=Filibacter tadaridae TaxID=2483811 RepID=A0A3P5XHQ3_9BACL|nr:DHA2 family efflux MFS transporter permease subunit [Filibacter tadaridae]VDC28079.1 putative multidrug resistance protein EmrY [Filibacter tadaridae]
MEKNVVTEEFRIKSIIVPLLAIIAGVFMVVLNSTSMNVALTTLLKDLNTDFPTIQWTVTGYMLAQASVIPLAGWLSDRFGAKVVFLSSITLFTIASVLCAIPNSAGWLIAFRVIQGLGGGCVIPVAMAYVYRLSPQHKVGTVMAMMGIPILFAPAIGPVLSGWMVEFYSWRWLFLINIPVGIISIIMGLKTLPKVERQTVTGIDLPGMILAPIAFAGLSYGVIEGANSWTSVNTIAGLVIGGIALVAFIIRELSIETPLLDLRVFRSIDFSIGIVVQWIGQFALFGAIFLLPQFLQQARGFGAFDTGMILLPQAIASMIVMPIAGYLFDRIGVRWLVVIGLGLVSGATYQYSQVDMTTTGKDLLVPLIMAGAGMGMMTMPMNTHLFNMAPRHLVSRVTSLTNSMQQVINSLSVATLVTILSARITFRTDEFKELAQSAPGSAPQTPEAMQQAIAGVAANSFGDTFGFMVIVAIIGAVLGLLLRREKTSS